MRRTVLAAYLLTTLGWGLVLAGCSGHRELVGQWTVVNSDDAPKELRQMRFDDEHHLTLSDGETCEYTTISDGLVKITFPDGKSYDYGYTRSGEYLTIVDNGRQIPYTLNQG